MHKDIQHGRLIITLIIIPLILLILMELIQNQQKKKLNLGLALEEI